MKIIYCEDEWWWEHAEQELAMLELVRGRPGFVQLRDSYKGELDGTDVMFIVLKCALHAPGTPVHECCVTIKGLEQSSNLTRHAAVLSFNSEAASCHFGRSSSVLETFGRQR